MRRKLTIFLLVAAVGTTLVACDQFGIGNTQPSDSVASNQAFTSQTGFEAVLTATYDRLQAFTRYGQYYQLYPDALADNAASGGGSGRYSDVIPNNTGLGGYGNMYEAINFANNIIAKIDGLDPDVSSEQQAQQIRDRIEGQARFLRALNYFDLMRVYAYEPGREVDGFDRGVIVRLNPTESATEADFRARVSNDSVYTQIVRDLERATTLLEGTSLSRNKANRAAAYGLLARVHLYLENWTEAEQAATQALNFAPSVVGTSGDLLVDQSGFEAAWAAPSHPESIFELTMQQGTDNDATFSNQSLSALSYAECASGSCGPGEFREFSFEVTPSSTLPYQSGDVRLSLIDTLSSGVPVLGKYTNTIALYTDRIPLIRVPEMYYIQAEARAEGAPGDPLAPLNEVRTARGLSAMTGSFTTAQIIDSVYAERRRELVYEGHRWFDLKRRGMDIPKPQANAQPVPYTNRRILSQLPPDEVSANPKLVQNPGY